MSPRKPMSTTATPSDPATVTGWPLGSRLNRVLVCVRTSKAGVPWSNRRVSVSPATAAVMVAMAGLDGVGVHEDEAGPELVQLAVVVAVSGLVAAGAGEFAAAAAREGGVSAPSDPQAHRSPRPVTRTRR